MKVIWKFEITSKTQTIELPIRSKFLTVQMQDETPCMWFIVDPEAKKDKHMFQIIGTGDKRPDEDFGEYRGTFQSGRFVWHVFEVTE